MTMVEAIGKLVEDVGLRTLASFGYFQSKDANCTCQAVVFPAIQDLLQNSFWCPSPLLSLMLRPEP